MFSKNRILAMTLVVILAMTASACVDDLNTSPLDDDVTTSATVYDTPENYKSVLAKLYAGFATTGQQGPAGNPDIQGIDEGFSSYLRQMWVAQVISTDEAVVGWNDPGLPDFNYQTWGASNDFVFGMYSRIYYQLALANEFIRNAKGNENPEIQGYLAEARFLRALSYWHALDLYGGGVPFVTEETEVGASLPNPTSAGELFDFIESELLAVVDAMPAAGQAEYGRADRAAAWTVLAKLYLNAEVYTGQAHYTEAANMANMVIESGAYTLDPDYGALFRADNHTADGVIFAIPFDGVNTTTYGGTTFIAHAQVGGNMNAAEFGLDGGWSGHRVTPQFVEKFDMDNDSRAMFFTNGQNLEVEEIPNFNDGYALTKWKNVTSTGQPGSDLTFVDIDFPMFRLADVYLTYAEAVLRGGEGSTAQAVDLVNQLRERAYGDASGNITIAELTLNFILDERARELYWEGQRRTDLVRYELFTGSNYTWAWKGNEQEGAGTESFRNVYPIPASDLNANPNLTQNPGY